MSSSSLGAPPIELGYSAWSTTRRDHRDEPIGGVVVAITDLVDDETGEVGPAFLCIDPFNMKPAVTTHLLRASEISFDGVEELSQGRLGLIVRRLAGDLAGRKQRLLDGSDFDRIAWLNTLAGVLSRAGLRAR